ncbi:SAM-dependent methyltransferase [Alloalcanivorax xenomutans]|uniref:SAM-dependent methyltransferase n=1 Tax=Alloalcanivorax xenomutans TaxID=1094342 RepID=UPI001F1FAE13|nr:cyclopropane-fatty-acyl-phospholipid synthase family protein [Alloalcanivorax xenomutans]MCE7522945.1 cyclopropane-fatty-acyl-phospholipid synthase family protein [Alloalcanivorax xenomutans]
MMDADKALTMRHPTWLQRVARKLVHRRLAALPAGGLSLYEPDGALVRFGNGDACLHISDWDCYRRMMTGGALGAAEAYMDGGWDSPDLVAVMRYFAANVNVIRSLESGTALLAKPLLKALHFANRNSVNGSRRNIAAHYDLGNAFFSLFLDARMMYSSAIYPDPEADLETAALHKLDLICRRLRLREGMHLLEIGTGWGGLAIYAARHYGVRVTTTTLSREQAYYAREEIKEAGLENRIEVLERDYRELTGTYDRVVSVEMVEAVGHQYLSGYFRILDHLLKPDGMLLLQAITVPEQRYEYARDNVDFIKRYIFPGGFLPSVTVMCDALRRHTRLVPVALHDIGLDYARTLGHWRERFVSALPKISEMGFDERFCRMWNYYLCYCQGAFLERAISTVHLVAIGEQYRDEVNPLRSRHP